MTWSGGALAVALALVLAIGAVAVPASRAPVPDLGWAEPDTVLRGSLERLPASGTLVLDAMDRPATPAEAASVRAFVMGGGRLLVARPSDAAASLLEAIGAGVHLAPGALFDPDVDGEGRFTASGTGTLAQGPLALAQSRIVSGGQPIVVSGPFAWHDGAGDGRPDLTDARGQWALAARAPLGAGEVVAVGAREILDADAAGPLRDWVRGGGDVVLDMSHVAGADPFGIAYALGGRAPLALAAAVLVPALAAVLMALRVRMRRVRAPRARRPLDLETLEMVRELPTGDGRQR